MTEQEARKWLGIAGPVRPEAIEALRDVAVPVTDDEKVAVYAKLRCCAGVPPVAVSGPGARLTPRETEVAALIAEGLSNREIAVRLFVSLSTVDTHAEHIRCKLGASSRLQVALWYQDERAPAAAPGR
jgi:DNA-binding NarL/FixJ family response regulator